MSQVDHVRVKVCGVTRVEDAIACVEAGVDAIGLNFWPGSSRFLEPARALKIVEAVRAAAADGSLSPVRLVGVVVDADDALIDEIRGIGVRWIQLHGAEAPTRVTELLPEAMKAVRLGDRGDLPEALTFPGEELLVDARVEGAVGGTGELCDWGLAGQLALRRRVWLAGGLEPSNVAEAVRKVRPFGVDVASGVERSPGVKDPARVGAFVHAARSLLV